ncbi:MAG: tRNA dimethylallyltransferase [Gemmatimonadetes bacterium]|nr:tRNA dimethylallyltransferase [Gemmatimonadota bacterium]
MWIAERRAERRAVTIVSADSRQVYRDFDVGTAKPSAGERARVPHRGLDVALPTERYSAAEWCASAAGWIDEAYANGHAPLVVGGTGLYLRALFDGLFEEPALDPGRRQGIAAALATLETVELRRWVERLDRQRAHLGRTQLLRAVEIALLTGRRMSDLHRDHARTPRWQARYLVVDPGPALADRIAVRIDHMLDNGWPDEVTRLMQTVPADAPAWNATGYDAVRTLVSGAMTRAAAREKILIATRQYAKRQRTWFRHQLPADRVTRVDPGAADWPATVERWLASFTPDERLA